MGLLSAAMRTELQKVNANVHWILDLALPGGTKRLGMTAVASAARGQYKGQITQIQRYARGSVGRDFALEGFDINVVLADDDLTHAKILEGAGANSVPYSAATLYLGSPNVVETDWLTEFSGVIDSFAIPEPRQVSYRLAPNGLPLDRFFPKVTITQADWPFASSDVRGQIPPLIYGKWNSGGGGAIPCLHVDTTGHRYMVCIGRAKAVDAVWKDSVVVTSGFSITNPVVNGRVYTLIDFTTDQGAGKITADVQGLEATGDGSGALLEEPAAVIKHLLVNWIFGDYMSGAWLADASAPVDVTIFSAASTFLSARGHKASRRFSGRQGRGVDIFDEACSGVQARPLWTSAGKLGIRIVDHAPAAVYGDTPWIRGDRHDLGFSLNYATDELIDRVTVNFLRDETRGAYTSTLEVRDPAITKEAPDDLELPWAYASAV